MVSILWKKRLSVLSGGLTKRWNCRRIDHSDQLRGDKSKGIVQVSCPKASLKSTLESSSSSPCTVLQRYVDNPDQSEDRDNPMGSNASIVKPPEKNDRATAGDGTLMKREEALEGCEQRQKTDEADPLRQSAMLGSSVRAGDRIQQETRDDTVMEREQPSVSKSSVASSPHNIHQSIPTPDPPSLLNVATIERSPSFNLRKERVVGDCALRPVLTRARSVEQNVQSEVYHSLPISRSFNSFKLDTASFQTPNCPGKSVLRRSRSQPNLRCMSNNEGWEAVRTRPISFGPATEVHHGSLRQRVLKKQGSLSMTSISTINDPYVQEPNRIKILGQEGSPRRKVKATSPNNLPTCFPKEPLSMVRSTTTAMLTENKEISAAGRSVEVSASSTPPVAADTQTTSKNYLIPFSIPNPSKRTSMMVLWTRPGRRVSSVVEKDSNAKPPSEYTSTSPLIAEKAARKCDKEGHEKLRVQRRIDKELASMKEKEDFKMKELEKQKTKDLLIIEKRKLKEEQKASNEIGKREKEKEGRKKLERRKTSVKERKTAPAPETSTGSSSRGQRETTKTTSHKYPAVGPSIADLDMVLRYPSGLLLDPTNPMDGPYPSLALPKAAPNSKRLSMMSILAAGELPYDSASIASGLDLPRRVPSASSISCEMQKRNSAPPMPVGPKAVFLERRYSAPAPADVFIPVATSQLTRPFRLSSALPEPALLPPVRKRSPLGSYNSSIASCPTDLEAIASDLVRSSSQFPISPSDARNLEKRLVNHINQSEPVLLVSDMERNPYVRYEGMEGMKYEPMSIEDHPPLAIGPSPSFASYSDRGLVMHVNQVKPVISSSNIEGNVSLSNIAAEKRICQPNEGAQERINHPHKPIDSYATKELVPFKRSLDRPTQLPRAMTTPTPRSKAITQYDHHRRSFHDFQAPSPRRSVSQPPIAMVRPQHFIPQMLGERTNRNSYNPHLTHPVSCLKPSRNNDDEDDDEVPLSAALEKRRSAFPTLRPYCSPIQSPSKGSVAFRDRPEARRSSNPIPVKRDAVRTASFSRSAVQVGISKGPQYNFVSSRPHQVPRPVEYFVPPPRRTVSQPYPTPPVGYRGSMILSPITSLETSEARKVRKNADWLGY